MNLHQHHRKNLKNRGKSCFWVWKPCGQARSKLLRMARLRLADGDNLSPSGNIGKSPVLKSLLQISFLGGFQASTACPSAKSSVSMKMSMEHWRNEADFKDQE
jgi:hypothetical protein